MCVAVCAYVWQEEVHPFLNSAKQRDVSALAVRWLIAVLPRDASPLSCSLDNVSVVVSHLAVIAMEVPIHRVRPSRGTSHGSRGCVRTRNPSCLLGHAGEVGILCTCGHSAWSSWLQTAIADVLMAMQASPPPQLVPEGQTGLAPSIVQPLRVGLMKILGVDSATTSGAGSSSSATAAASGSDAAPASLSDRIVECLTKLGWGDKAQAMLSSASEPLPAAPPKKTGPGSTAAVAVGLVAKGPVIAPDDVNALKQLPPSVLTDVLIENLRYLPPEPTTPTLALTRCKQVCPPVVRCAVCSVDARVECRDVADNALSLLRTTLLSTFI